MLDRSRRLGSRSRALASAGSAVVEALETRRMLYETGGHWENEDDLSFSYVNVFDGGIQDSLGNALPDATIRSAILEAMSVWAGVVPVMFRQVPDSGPQPSDIAYFGSTRTFRFGHHFDDGPLNNIGHAWGPDDLSSLAGDVHIDNAESWGTVASGSTVDLLELLVHEVGHGLGMHHEDDLTCIMNSNQGGFYSGLGSAFLFQDDINGIQSLYGAGLGYVLTDVDRLFVSGTNSADTITVDYDSATDDLIVTSQGIGDFRIDEDSVLELVIDTRGGNDTVRIINLPSDTDVVINAGSGNDTINVGGGDLNTNILSDVTVNGGSGTDTLYIRDGDDDGGTYDINPANISKPNSNLVSYPAGDLEELIVVGTAFTDTFKVGGDAINSSFDMELQGNDGADVFNINFVDSVIDVTVLGGNDNDTITVGNSSFDANIDGTVDVDGGDSTDTLIIDDVNDVGGDTYEINSASFSKDSGDGVVTFSNVTSFDVNGGGGIDEYSILGVASGTTTSVDGRAGNDTFEISPYDYDSNLLGNLVIDGGGGTADYMEIRDSSDAGNDAYTLTDETATFGTAFYKAIGGITFFSALEQLHIQGNNDNNTFTVYGTEFGTRVTLYGLGGNDEFFIGNGDLDPIDDELVIWAGAGNDSVTFDDSLDAPVPLGDLPAQYRINNESVVKVRLLPNFEQPFDYFEVEDIVVEGNADGNTFTVQSTGAALVLNGNNGNDRYNIGFENNVKDINHMVEANGDAGTDSLYYNDAAATLDRTYTVSPNNLSRTNVAVTRPYVDEIIVNAGTGNDTFNVTNNVSTSVNGGGGDDTFNVADGLWDFGVIGTLSVDGGGGSDHLLIDDMDDAGADSYSLNEAVATKNTAFAQPITYTTIESLELAANSEANIINVFNTFDGDVKVRGRGGADQINVAETFPGRAVTVEDGPDLDIVGVNANGVGTAAAVFTTTQDLSSLIIGTGGKATLTAGGNKVINTQLLSLTGTAVLDLTDNAMIVDYTGASPINGIIAILIGAYNGGAWNKPGITSSTAAAGTSTALGYAEATDLFSTFPATFAGQSIDNTSILIKHTLYGDTDLNGNVNLSDFNRLAANFGLTSGARWTQGNLDFNGNVNLSDFNKLAANFGGSGLTLGDPEQDDEGAHEDLTEH